MEKRYICNRWKFYKIGKQPGIHFEDGIFVTSDEALQAAIEAHEDYGIHIHPQDYVVPVFAEISAPESEPETLVIGKAHEDDPPAPGDSEKFVMGLLGDDDLPSPPENPETESTPPGAVPAKTPAPKRRRRRSKPRKENVND